MLDDVRDGSQVAAQVDLVFRGCQHQVETELLQCATAVKLADVFIASETSAGAKSHAYFESDGKRLLSHFLFAAAIANRPITDVFTWAQDSEDKTARDLLDEQGYQDFSSALWKIQELTPQAV